MWRWRKSINGTLLSHFNEIYDHVQHFEHTLMLFYTTRAWHIFIQYTLYTNWDLKVQTYMYNQSCEGY
jgi:hypothetical protein